MSLSQRAVLFPTWFAQSELGLVIEAAERLINAVAVRENALNRCQKESHLHRFCWHDLPGADGHLAPALKFEV